MGNTKRCPNRFCLNGWVYENVNGRQKRKTCKKCGGSGTVPK